MHRTLYVKGSGIEGGGGGEEKPPLFLFPLFRFNILSKLISTTHDTKDYIKYMLYV